MRRSTLSVCFLSSFILTIFALQWWQQPAYPLSLWMILGCAQAAGILAFLGYPAWIFRWERLPGLLRCIGLCAFGMMLAFLTVARVTRAMDGATVNHLALGRPVTLQGIVSDIPDRRLLLAKYTLAVSAARAGSGQWMPVSGNVLVNDTKQLEEYHYGDQLRAKGILQKPASSQDFDYASYLRRFGIGSVLSKSSLTLVMPNQGNPILSALYGLRETFENQIDSVYPEPDASLLAGLLLGSRRGIPDHAMQDFKNTGLTHLVAISGYNITMILTLLYTLLFWLPVKWRFWPSVGVIVLFTLLTGSASSAVRAAIMGILGLIALQTERIESVHLTLLWTAFLMLLWNPLQLWDDVGFQLSFLALIGLVELYPLLRGSLTFLPDALNLRESAEKTLAAQIATNGWILFLFGTLSLIAPVGNLLVPPLVPIAMLFGFAGVGLSFLFPFVGQLTAAFGNVALWLILWLTHALATLPFASLQLNEKTGILFVIAYYAVIGGWVGWMRRREWKQRT